MADEQLQPKPDAEKVKCIRINTGVVKRLAKEKMMYKKQYENEEAKVKKMEEDGRDEHDIKLMRNVCGETYVMIGNVGSKLRANHDVLCKLVQEVEDDELIKETTEYCNAQEILKSTEEALNA